MGIICAVARPGSRLLVASVVSWPTRTQKDYLAAFTSLLEIQHEIRQSTPTSMNMNIAKCIRFGGKYGKWRESEIILISHEMTSELEKDRNQTKLLDCWTMRCHLGVVVLATCGWFHARWCLVCSFNIFYTFRNSYNFRNIAL